jgi:hypothetical protein
MEGNGAPNPDRRDRIIGDMTPNVVLHRSGRDQDALLLGLGWMR